MSACVANRWVVTHLHIVLGHERVEVRLCLTDELRAGRIQFKCELLRLQQTRAHGVRTVIDFVRCQRREHEFVEPQCRCTILRTHQLKQYNRQNDHTMQECSPRNPDRPLSKTMTIRGYMNAYKEVCGVGTHTGAYRRNGYARRRPNIAKKYLPE